MSKPTKPPYRGRERAFQDAVDHWAAKAAKSGRPLNLKCLVKVADRLGVDLDLSPRAAVLAGRLARDRD
jgi:hypothetical protein